MESTGQYGRAVWTLLEGRIAKLLLFNPLHVKAIAGKKTAAIDSERIAELLESGRLTGSFVPPRALQELRELTRMWVHLLED